MGRGVGEIWCRGGAGEWRGSHGSAQKKGREAECQRQLDRFRGGGSRGSGGEVMEALKKKVARLNGNGTWIDFVEVEVVEVAWTEERCVGKGCRCRRALDHG